MGGLAVLVSRTVVMFGLTWVINWHQRSVSLAYQHVQFRGGMRSAISLALSLPAALPHRELLRIMLGCGVVHADRPGHDDAVLALATGLYPTCRGNARVRSAARVARQRLEVLHREGSISDPTWEQLVRGMDDQVQQRELLNH
jgi:hypothetical protein